MQKRTNIKKLQNLNDEQMKQEKIVEFLDRDEIIKKLKDQYSMITDTPECLQNYKEIRDKYELGQIERHIFSKIPSLLNNNVDILEVGRENDEKIDRYMAFIKDFNKSRDDLEKNKLHKFSTSRNLLTLIMHRKKSSINKYNIPET